MSTKPVVKLERHDEAEIRELASKIMEANKAKMAAANARPAANTIQNNPMSLLGLFARKPQQAVPRAASAVNEDKKDEDIGKFGWITLGKAHIPYIFRFGEKYCAVRMVELKLLNKYLNYLHQDIYSCTCIRSYYITEAECRLLNEINVKHCDHQFGRDLFTQRDLVVRVSDAIEFYRFLDVCYTKLIGGTSNPKDRCGFIRINKESVVPYTVRGDSKFVPLFYFEGETDNLKLKADELEGWDLSYLKFCCKVQGIRNELFANETCAVISLNDIKSYFPPGTGFEEYWPSKVVDSQLLVPGKGGGHNGLWTRPPATPAPVVPAPTFNVRAAAVPNTRRVAAATATIPGLTTQALGCNGWAGLVGGQQSYNNTQLSNQLLRQMTHAVSLGMQMQPQQGRPSQRSTPQYYPVPQTAAPPPLVRTTVPQHSLGYPTYGKDDWVTGTYTSPALSAQTVSQPFLMNLSEQGLMPPPGNTVNYATVARAAPQSPRSVTGSNVAQSRQAVTPGLEHSHQVSAQQQQQQQQVNTRQSTAQVTRSMAPAAQLPPPLIPVNGNQQNARSPGQCAVNNGRAAHLSSMHSTVSGTTTVSGAKTLTEIKDTPTTSLHLPFKVQKALVENVMVPCINMKPYVYNDLLITLPDLVSYLFPKHSIHTIRQVLELLGLELFKGNRQQMQVLRESGKCQTVTESLPLVQIRDVLQYMPQIKYMTGKTTEEAAVASHPGKRQRTS